MFVRAKKYMTTKIVEMNLLEYSIDKQPDYFDLNWKLKNFKY